MHILEKLGAGVSAAPNGAAVLLVAALVPAVVLCAYVYRKDRAEKEPARLLLLMLVLGALATFPAGWLESFAGVFENALAVRIGEVQSDGTIAMSTLNFYGYQFLHYFLNVAVVEEGLKWLVLFLVIRKNKNFNSLFDGIVYAVFVSLGFALLENILYVFKFGMATALMRAVTAVPGHAFFGVFMGWFFSLYKISKVKSLYEKRWGKTVKSVIAAGRADYFLVMSFLAPVFLHGLYDFSTEFSRSSGAFIVVLGFLYIVSFRKIRRISSEDNSIDRIAGAQALAENPDIGDTVNSHRR
mgnify:CR=1 FL=1